MYLKFALRDAAIISLAAAFWWLAAERSAGAGVLADLTGVMGGVLLGAVGFVLHEWGHVLAGLAVGGGFHINENLRSPSLFSIDGDHTSIRQFTISSLGGFAVTAVTIWCFYAYLPEGWLATRVARGIAVFLASLTLLLEVPLLLFTLWQGAIPAAAAVKIQTAELAQPRA